MRRVERESWLFQLIRGYDEALREYETDRVEDVLSAVGPARWRELLLDKKKAKLSPLPSTPERLRTALAKLTEDDAIRTLAILSCRLRFAFALKETTAFLHGGLCPGRETSHALDVALDAPRLILGDIALPYWSSPFDINGRFCQDDWDNSLYDPISLVK